MFLMIEGKFLFPKGFISLTLMGGEKEAVAGAGVSLSPPPYPSCVQDYKCGTWTHFGWTPVDALLLSTTSGPFRVLLVALKQCLVGKTLIAT